MTDRAPLEISLGIQGDLPISSYAGIGKAAEEAGFDILLTTDQNLVYQQNLNNRKIAIVALGRNRWSLIEPALQRIALAVSAVQPGSYTLVDIPGK